MLETGQGALAGSGREALPLPGTKETAMFASHLIGPAAQMACDDPLAAVNHERRLALAQPATAARRPRRGRHVPARQAVSLLRGGRALLTGLATSLGGMRRLSA
jgi:hypothetical protein